ncbi:MAG: hypothetical protein ACRDRJ_34830 [Streptosporangiaceae bacterium]
MTMDDAARVALDLPGVTEEERHGHRTWKVAGQAFAWERPFSKADLRRQLRLVSPQPLRDAITDGWLACAPPALTSDYLKR